MDVDVEGHANDSHAHSHNHSRNETDEGVVSSPDQLLALELGLDDDDESEYAESEAHEYVAATVSSVHPSHLAASQPAGCMKDSLKRAPATEGQQQLARSCFAMLRSDKGPSDFTIDELMTDEEEEEDEEDDDTHSISELTANVNAALSRFDALAAQSPQPQPQSQPRKAPIVVVVNTTRPVPAVALQAAADEDDGDLTNLSWLQNTNLLQQLQTAANDRGSASSYHPRVLSPVDSEAGSEAEAEPQYVLFGDTDVQASQYVTLGDESNAEHLQSESKLDAAAFERPPYSLNSLIFMAIESSAMKCLPVRDIYEWITSQFPYYRRAPSGWKNSIRHTLSLGRCFKRFIADLKTPSVDSAADESKKANRSLVANLSINAKTHLNAFAKGALWMVDPDQRPALIQGLHRTLWELRHAVRGNQRPSAASLYAPSAHLAPLLGSSLFADREREADLEKKIVREMTRTSTPVKSDVAAEIDDDMSAVHALVALKSGVQQTQQNLVANLLSEAVATRGLDVRGAIRGRGRRSAHDYVTPTPADHDYIRCHGSASRRTDADGFAVPNSNLRLVAAESISVSSMCHDGTLQDEIVNAASLCDVEGEANDSFFSSSASSSGSPRRKAARKTKPEFRVIGDSQCVALSDLAALASTRRCVEKSAEKRCSRGKLIKSRRRKRPVDDHCDCCKCTRRQFGSRRRPAACDNDAGRRITLDISRLTRKAHAHAQDTNQNEPEAKHRPVISRSWKEYKRIVSRRDRRSDQLEAVTPAETPSEVKVEKEDNGIEAVVSAKPHTMVTRSKSGRVSFKALWRVRSPLREPATKINKRSLGDVKPLIGLSM